MKKKILKWSLIILFLVGSSYITIAATFENKLQPTVSEAKQEITVKGMVTNESDLPIPGVNVYVKGTNTGVITDFDGKYLINVPDKSAIIVFSATGMQTQEKMVGDATTINVVLIEELQNSKEEVVVGYGKVQKGELTGAVSSIDIKNLDGIPNARIDRILQGQAAGMQVTNINGSPGMGTIMRIRGGNSIEGNNQPLWVIDGIIVGQNYDLNYINSSDIASIEILKDASSVAIYGSRGANGVVMVTTKTGKFSPDGKPVINANINSGVQSIMKFPDLMTGPEHAAYANEAAVYLGTGETFPDLSKVPNTNWFDLVTQNAAVYNADLSVSGTSKDNNINYYLSGNYYNQDGVVVNSGIQKYTFRANLEINLSKTVKAGFRLNYSDIALDNGTVKYGSIANSDKSVVNSLGEREVYDETGAYNGRHPYLPNPVANIYADSKLNINETNSNNLLSSLYLEYNPTNKIMLRTTFNPEISNIKHNVFNSSQAPDVLLLGTGGSASINTVNSRGWNNENTIRYTTNIGSDQKLIAVGGFTLQKYTAEMAGIEAFGTGTDATTFHNVSLGSDPSKHQISSDYNAFQLVSFLGRVNYSLKDKYLATLVGRADGSSRFAQGNQYAFFPSVAVAWRLSKEPFIENLNLFDELKLRSSYGKSGSQAIESFRTMALMTEAKTTFNGSLLDGAIIGRPANKNLKWETTYQLDIGLEASLLKNRLSIEIDYYKKRTEDLLLEVNLPRQTGYSSRLENLGEIENKGLEFLIKTINVSKPNFKWSSSFNISGNRSEVIDLGGVSFKDVVTTNDQSGPAQRLILGESVPAFVGVEYLGTWKTEAEIQASSQKNEVVGGMHLKDTNGDGSITTDDFEVLGSPEATFIYGLQNNFSYKNFDLSFFIQGTHGNDIYNALTQIFYFGRDDSPKYAEVVNRWTPTNTESNIPRAGVENSLSDIKVNTEFIENGSHLRLKSLRLAYHLPVNKWGMRNIENLTVYFVGRNLLLLSDFRLIDPEVSMYGYSENIALGISKNEYPNPRIVSFGVNLTF